MEDLVGAYAGRRILVTGHTGFKGSWLCEWLLLLGAEITGFSLDLPTHPSIFDQLGLTHRISDLRGDVRDSAAVSRAVDIASPDYVFHLAAQPLVRASYDQPVTTLQTNVLGTVHLLEALRPLRKPCAAIIISSDKCYENRENDTGYREDDSLGGRDPYSASKACAEILTAAWRQSFFAGHPVRIASARAGNVIGGGDWAADRLVPDAIRALSVNRPIPVRNLHSIRPWQHVLEPLGGYLLLAAKIAADTPDLTGPLNFGPPLESHRPARDVIETLLKYWPGSWTDASTENAPHEAGKLFLNIDKVGRSLGWTPRWNFEIAVEKTVEWYREAIDTPSAIPELTRRQIASYLS